MSFLCSLPIIAGLVTGCGTSPMIATGYVEGEYVLLAPVESGRIDSIMKKRGDRVANGELLVQMEATDAEIAVKDAMASLAQAKAQLGNLKEGRRPEEIAVIAASLESARAQAAEAERNYRRQSDLSSRGVAPQSGLDQAETALAQARAMVDQISANLAVARLPARKMEIDAADAAVRQAEARLANARWRLGHRRLTVPFSGMVDDVVRRTGEVAGPSQPVLSILPDGGIKIRLYAPEKMIAGLKDGSLLKINCDGCAGDLKARVTYISDAPEFTPPVIYSIENRQKLVYLIEAKPDSAAAELKPGQIVDARPDDQTP